MKKYLRGEIMFKSSFAKHISAFVLIIFASFLILSGIISTMIRHYADDSREEKLDMASKIIIDYINDEAIVNLDIAVRNGVLPKIIEAMVRTDPQYDVIVANSEGKIILSSITDGDDELDVGKRLGELPDGLFKPAEDETYLVHNGDLGGFLPEKSMVFLREVIIDGEVAGYVAALASAVREDNLVSITRNALIHSAIWVMLAAFIAAYFITERIVHPLRVMTKATKEMAKGDFSARVTVYGSDEVAELGKAFNNMAESLDSLEKMRNSFLANVSHDLRTPMTTISGFIDGITSGAIPQEKHDYYLGVISAEVHRLSRLVSQLLDISKLESGERKFNFVEFDVAELARIILISFEQKIEEKRLEVEFIAEEDEMLVTADKDAIHQVLYNLCHNAIKFSNVGGKFIISLSRTQGRKIKISVFDEGQSIANEDKRMVFDRFYKTDKSRGLDKSGVGLGLYICKTIIDAHEEDIWVESEEDKSCEFIFTLKETQKNQKKK